MPIPENVRALVVDRIDSVEQLEVLLLLRGDPDREWTVAAIAAELRTGAESVTVRCEGLERAGLIGRAAGPASAAAPAFRYAARTPELDVAVSGLEAAYRTRRYSILDLIFSKPSDKVQVFAKAFRIRKGADDA